jgi:hypothetical protein
VEGKYMAKKKIIRKTIVITPELNRKIVKLAKKEKRSTQAMIFVMLEENIKAREINYGVE